MINYQDFFTTDPNVMLGKPVIKGTRITVELILRKLEEGATVSDLKVMFPGISHESMLAIMDQHK